MFTLSRSAGTFAGPRSQSRIFFTEISGCANSASGP